MNILVGYEKVFSASHEVPDEPRCSHPHGHTFRVCVEVFAKGPLDDATPGLLRESLSDVVREMDGRSIGEMAPGASQSLHGIAAYIGERLKLLLKVKRVVIFDGTGHMAMVEWDDR